MPWKLEWYDEKENTVAIFPVDPWTWEEFGELGDELRATIDSKPHKVNMLFRFDGNLTLPKPSTQTAEWVPPWMPIREQMLNEPKNRGLAIVVAAPLFMESIMATVKSQVKGQMTIDHIKFVKTLEEADRLIAEVG